MLTMVVTRYYHFFPSFGWIRAGSKQSGQTLIMKIKKKDYNSLCLGMEVKFRSRLQGCQGGGQGSYGMQVDLRSPSLTLVPIQKQFVQYISTNTPMLPAKANEVRSDRVGHRSLTPQDYFRAHLPTHITAQRTAYLEGEMTCSRSQWGMWEIPRAFH